MSRFTKNKEKIFCKHLDKRTKVISSTFTCETTVVICLDCNKELTEPKTECR